MTRLVLPDAHAARDLATFAARAHAVAPTGSVRLFGAGAALACWAGVLEGQGLLGSGLVLGLRVVALPQPFAGDVTLASERLAAAATGAADAVGTSGEGPVLDLDSDPLPPRWTAQTPPRSGWEPVGRIAHDDVVAASRAKDPAAQADSLPDAMTNAVAIALRGLGLLPAGCDPVLYRTGPWRRLSTPAGHVLTR